ncbi:MAG: hypothetical protein ABII00_12075 [Elusimicrobiota bacterium]
MRARAERARRGAGDIERELEGVRGRIELLHAQIDGRQQHMSWLDENSEPVDPDEEKAYQETLRLLGEKRDEEYVLSKLAEIHDLAAGKPAAGKDVLSALKELETYYESLLPTETENPGYQDSLGTKLAVMKAVEQALVDYKRGPVDGRKAPAPRTRLDEEAQGRIEPIVSELEGLRDETRGALANRDALDKLLAAVARTRNLALRERRGGGEMLEFHKNVSRLAMVMDLAFSLNTIDAAQKALLEMQQMLDRKLERIRGVRDQAGRDLAETEANRQRSEEFRQKVRDDIAEKTASQKDMKELSDQTELAVRRISAFRTEVSALLSDIDGKDAHDSGDALSEYNRRKAELPKLVEWSTNGKPGDEDFLSLKELQEKLADIEDYIQTVNDGLSDVASAPLEFAGVLVLAVPGEPEFNVTNPDASTTLQLLSERKTHWQNELANYQEDLDEFRNRLDASYSGTEDDDFGDSHPLSLPKRLAEAQGDVSRYSGEAGQLTARIDAAAAEIMSVVPGADLPALSGRDLEAMQDAIEAYPDKITGITFPSEFTPENFNAKMALFLIGRLLPQAGRAVIGWSKADATVETIQEALASPVPQSVALYENVVEAVQAVIDDVDADVAFVQGGTPSLAANQALVDRKLALLNRLQPVLVEAKSVISTHAIPYQQDTIDSYSPTGDTWAKLFDGQITLYEGIEKALDRTLPWALATWGAKDGDAAAAEANIGAMRDKFNDLLNGYTDEKGYHEGVLDHIDDLRRRTDPNNTDMEDVYGQPQPYSLPKKISQYTAEKRLRTGDINRQHVEINGILARIDQLTEGRFNLRSWNLPDGIDAESQASVDRIKALIDDKVYQTLGDLLTDIGNEYKDKGESVSMGGDGDEMAVPQGEQDPLKVDDNTMVALLALETAKRLVPSTNQELESAAAAYAVARFLYSDGVVEAAEESLSVKVPFARDFLARAQAGLENALTDLDKDSAYAASDGTTESADAVVDRKLSIFGQLNAITREGIDFWGTQIGWDNDSFETIDQMGTYYDATRDLYENSGTVADNELDAILEMKDALKKTFDDLQDQRRDVENWLGQLNPKEESALKRVAEDMRKIQDKTKAVLEQNIRFRDLEARFKRSEQSLEWTLGRTDDSQQRLAAELRALDDPASLDPRLRQRIEALRIKGGSWHLPAGSDGDASAIIVPKRDFSRFVDTIFSSILKRASSTRDLGELRQRLLDDPRSLTNVLPGSQILEFGDADGFYLVYQTQFAVPHTLETSNWVTLGNIAQLWGNNISVTGYQFGSPPTERNAPYGDKGIEVQVESLQGSNWVNYLNVDFHRFLQDIPADMKMDSTARQSRMMLFDDFAMMLFGDRLYVALTGFGDFATQDTFNKPHMFGGSAKTSLKFTEVMRLNAEQQRMYANDPRFFMQKMNLDFTDLDKELNKDWVIESRGDNKRYVRTQIGPSFDVARLIGSDDAFTVDLHWARQEGTDDYNQDAYGVTVLKGFTFRDDSGEPWMVLSAKAGAEAGTEYNTLSGRVSMTLPNQGIVLSGEGRILGDTRTYYLQASKKLGDYSNVSAGYGSRYVGRPNRLTISMNSSFTLGQLWSSVVKGTAEGLQGADALKAYNQELDDFFKEGEDDTRVSELRAVFMRDVGMKLVKQDIGTLAKEIRELRKAGAFADNTRIQGMVGFVTNPVGDAPADRAIGGGPVAGTYTSLTLTRGQKQLIDAKMKHLYRESLRLQFRMLDLTKQWQETVTEIAQAQWELKMAGFMAERAPTEALRREGAAKQSEAKLRLDQASIRYNMLSGRSPYEELPFDNLSAGELKALLAEIHSLTQTPDRLGKVLHTLDQDEIEAQMGPEPFNLMDWIPFIERLTLSFGTQIQDHLSNQVLGAGVTLRVPIYDPVSGDRNNAYKLEGEATVQEILEVHEEYGLRARQELAEARFWSSGARTLSPQVARSADALADAIRAYRNGLVPESRLRESFGQWHWYVSNILRAESKAALAAGWSQLDASFARPRQGSGASERVGSFQEAFDIAGRNSRSISEIGLRQQAAEHMTRANAHRIQKFYADIHIGNNFTAAGVGWLPSFGITGFGVTPIPVFELKSAELAELQKAQGEQHEEYYRNLQTRLEADLAVSFFQNIATWERARDAERLLNAEIIPRLEADLRAAQRRAGDGDSRGEAPRLQRELDQARRRLHVTQLAGEQAKASLNYLLGRPEGAELHIGISAEQALADLEAILAQKRPEAADGAILDARVKVARAVELIIDKGMKVEELYLEPVSLAVRSLGRLMKALSEETIGDPDLMAAARVQTLEAERAQSAYEGDLAARRAQLNAELDAVEQASEAAKSRTDAASRLDEIERSAKSLNLRAALARLGEAPAQEGPNALPRSYHKLEQALMDAEQSLASAGREPEVEAFEPELRRGRVAGNFRYYYAHTSLGFDKINEHFIDSWVEFRMRSMETPPEVLMALAELRMDKADRVHRNDAAAARSRAGILLSQFETNVRLLRWAEEFSQGPREPQGSRAERDFETFKHGIKGRLDVQAARIKALLGLPAETTVSDIARLLPKDRSGESQDIRRVAKRFVDEVEALRIDQIRRTIFEDGVPESFGNEDGLIHQIRADVIAERMSYKGFTPVAAFGIFRAQGVGGLFFEAPDPRSIEQGLERVLSDSVRRELQSQGRMQGLALRLHLLMSSVKERATLVERQNALVEAAQEDYFSAVARAQDGLIDQDELLSAQDALVGAWIELSGSMAQLKNDFIELVTELEAVGYAEERLLNLPAGTQELSGAALFSNRMDALLDYGAGRMLDEEFAGRLGAALRGAPGIDAEAVRLLLDEAQTYRKMRRDAEIVRHSGSFGAAERLKLLTQADVEGRRERVRARLGALLSAARADPASRQSVLGVLMRDLEGRIEGAADFQQSEMADLSGIRRHIIEEVFTLDASPDPRGPMAGVDAETRFAVRGALERIEVLRGERLASRQALLESYVGNKYKSAGSGRLSPTDFIMRDAALDEYLKAVEAYDAEVVKLFAMPEVRGNERMVRSLNGLLSVRETLRRQVALANHGRGMLAIDSLIMLEEARLAARRFERAPAPQLREASDALRRLVELRGRWASGEVSGLAPLYAVVETDAQGRRTWSAAEWYTRDQLGRLGDLETDESGRTWLKARAGEKVRHEVIAGVDAAAAVSAFAREALETNKARLGLGEVFEKHEFAAVSLDGSGARGMSYEEAERLSRSGRAFYFSREADRSGLRPAGHPLKSLWDDPAGVETILYLGDEDISHDAFPTRESLSAHLDRLGAGEAADFARLEAGPKGVAKMIEYAAEHERRARTVGWIGVKLQSYGYAVDADGRPRVLILTQEEFDQEVKALQNSPATFRQAQNLLEKANAAEAAARARRDAQKELTDAEGKRHQLIEAEARARFERDVEQELPRLPGETEADHQARVKAELHKRVVEDGRYKAAQRAFSAQLEKFNKLDEAHLSTRREADKALRAFKGSGRLIAHAGHWQALGADYMAALEAAGVDERSREREQAELSATSPMRLFVSRDTAFHFDARGGLARVTGLPVFGRGALDERIGLAEAPVTKHSGELFGAVLDRDASAVRLYWDMDSLEKAAEGWTIEDVHVTPAADGKSRPARYVDGGVEIDPNYRLKRYIDPAAGANGLPVMLSRRYFIARLTDAGREQQKAKGYGTKLSNWSNIIGEIPGGILRTPVELLTGRDPNQHHFLGRAHMYKFEGGATNHQGPLHKVAHFIDILDLLPDPVNWYFDANQFPDKVRLDSAILPHQNIYGKNARSDDKDIHFGRPSLDRAIVHRTEDLLNASRGVLSYFEGGVRTTWIEQRRGRAPALDSDASALMYQTSRVTERTGIEAIEDALRDGAVATDPDSYTGERPVRLSGSPGHIAVDRVERRVLLRPGAYQYGRIVENLKGFPQRIEDQERAARDRAPALERASERAQSDLASKREELGRARSQEGELWGAAHPMAWRIGAQRALEAEMSRAQAELERLSEELLAEQRRLKELADELKQERRRERREQSPFKRFPWLPWAAAAVVMAALLAAVWEWLRRRTESLLAPIDQPAAPARQTA